MEKKLPEDQVKSVLAPWRFSWQLSGFKNRLVTALELYEHFPLCIAITGGTKSANTRLAYVVCGLKDKQESEEEETDDDEDIDEEEESTENEEDEDSSCNSLVKDIDNFTEDGPGSSPVLFHPHIPNVHVFTVQDNSDPALDSYDVMIALTTELHQEDHMRLTMEQYEKNKPLYLVKTDRETDIVRQKLTGPCKTCAWERMRARTLEFQKKHKVELKVTESAEDQQASRGHLPHYQIIKLWEPDEIADVLLKAIPELRKKAFSQFLVDLTNKLKGQKTESYSAGPLASFAFKSRSISQEDQGRMSAIFKSQDLTDQPHKLLSIFNAMEHFRLDVGLLGETGCGSSSLFNSLLELNNGDQGASPIGVFETTKKPVTYPYSKFHNVLLWDLPGLGSVEEFQTSSSGLTSHKVPPVPPCDVYFLISPLRFNLRYIQLLKQFLSQEKSCYLVLSKADLIEEKSVEDVRRWNEEIVEKLGLKQNIYLVSALHPETLDLPKLTMDFSQALERHKRVALADHVTTLLEQDVFWKRADTCKIN